MDFCINEPGEESVVEKNLSDLGFFSKNLVTFIDFETFQEMYLSSYEYNDPFFNNIGYISLQPKSNIPYSYPCDVDGVKLR